MDREWLELSNRVWIHPALDVVMIGFTTIGLMMLPLGAIYLLVRGKRRVGWTLLVAQASALAVTLVFQYLAMRPRPMDIRLLLPPPPQPSFPSGHAALAFATAVALVLICRRWWVAVVVLAGAAGIAYSRLYLGHHYLSDVVAGMMLGASVGAGVYGLMLAGGGVRSWKWLVWPQAAIGLLVTQMAYLNLLPRHLLMWAGADKVLHFLLFGAVVLWLNLWWMDRRWQVAGWRLPVALIVPVTIALIDEVVQGVSPLRTFDLWDFLCGVVGMFVFYRLSLWLLAKSALGTATVLHR